jgi:hypothetical protein
VLFDRVVENAHCRSLGNLKTMRLSLRLRGLWDEPPSHARGAIAQLAERLDRTQEVAGSNPASSMLRSPRTAGASVFQGISNRP